MPLDEPYTRRIQPDESPSIGVVRTIAALKNSPSCDLDPLAESIESDAFDRLVGHDDGAVVEFEYEGLCVTVDGQTITVRNATE
ncbi:HalOD1 output domain-containing protein [Halosimplex sp. TS25]|uniref:HalOD1 output domain-containing protein n=1 Tax=Halosimplex rarum TaxID=3396619 RepID=UPI0039ECE126